MVGKGTWRHVEVNMGDIKDKFSHSVGNGTNVLPL